MNDNFETLYEIALQENNAVLSDEGYKAKLETVMELEEKYEKLDLPEKQRAIIDDLLQANSDLYDKEMQILYRKGFKDCAGLLGNDGLSEYMKEHWTWKNMQH